MNKDYMRETIIFKAKDNNGNIVECTPHLFVVALAKATGTNVDAVKAKISKSSSRFKKKLQEVLNEERLPTGGELMSFTTILGTSKDKVEKAFAVLVKADTISSNGTKASEVNTLNLQFTWPKTWGEDVKDIGSAICEVFNSKDLVKDALFCNFTASNNTIEVGADSEKFESAQSFGKLIEALRTVINYIYINSPFDASVNELDEPIYKLVDDAVYSTLHEVALNGVEKGVDLAPLQKYLYQKGVVNLPNVNDDTIKTEDRKEPNNQATESEQTTSKSKIVFEIECDDKLVDHPAFSKYFTDGNVAKFVSTFKPDENDIKDPKVAYDFFSNTMKLMRLLLSDLYNVYYKDPVPASLMMPLWEFQQRCGSSYEDQLNAHNKICSLTLPSGPLSCFFPDGKPIVPSCFRPKESVKKAATATITNTPVEIEMTLPKVTIKSSSGKIDAQLIGDVVKIYDGKVDLEINI